MIEEQTSSEATDVEKPQPSRVGLTDLLGDCGCSDLFRERFRDLTVQLSAHANNAVFSFPSNGPGRSQAAYVRDGVVATCRRLLRFVVDGE